MPLPLAPLTASPCHHRVRRSPWPLLAGLLLGASPAVAEETLPPTTDPAPHVFDPDAFAPDPYQPPPYVPADQDPAASVTLRTKGEPPPADPRPADPRPADPRPADPRMAARAQEIWPPVPPPEGLPTLPGPSVGLINRQTQVPDRPETPDTRPPKPGTGPALVLAEAVTYDPDAEEVVAEGRVEISQGDYVLLAERVRYDRVRDVVKAEGRVSLLDPTGNVAFSEQLEVTGDLKDAVAQRLGLLMEDNTRAAANRGVRRDDKIDLWRAVYSPCRLCDADPDRPPLWQLKSRTLHYDQTTHVVRHRDTRLEVGGVPVFWTPYLAHADGTIDRKTGLLPPSWGQRSGLGTYMQQPFFWAIAPDRDLTLTPRLYLDNVQPLMDAEYRQRFGNGEFSLHARGTFEPEGGKQGDTRGRGDIRLDGAFALNPAWRATGTLHRVSDDTFLRRYGYSFDDWLTSQLSVERLVGNQYADITGYLFQDLRADVDNDTVPVVAPVITLENQWASAVPGAWWTYDLNTYNILRKEGMNTARLSNRLGWHLPMLAPGGQALRLDLTVQGDLYGVDSQPRPDGVGTWSGTTGRLFPQAMLSWRWPLVRQHDGWQEVLEPQVTAKVAPNGNNPWHIPNEDSVDVEFDNTDLFQPTRFSGLDRVEPGQWVDYGIRWSGFAQGGGNASMLVGQSYRFQKYSPYPVGTGLEDQVSDIVGRVDIQPESDVDLMYAFRFDHATFAPRQTEVAGLFGPETLRVGVDYLNVAPEQGLGLDEREEIAAGFQSQFRDYWWAFGGFRKRLNNPAGMVSQTFGIGYRDECFELDLTYEREFYDDRDLTSQSTILLQIHFKNLGGFRRSVFGDQQTVGNENNALDGL